MQPHRPRTTSPLPVGANAPRLPPMWPLAVRSRVPLGEDVEERVRDKIGRVLRTMGRSIERVTVRFDDENGPRGGIDTTCRIEVVLGGAPNVVIEQRGRSGEDALAHAAPRLARAVRRAVDRLGGRATGAARFAAGGAREAFAPPPPAAPRESLIDRSVGRSRQNLERALERPEKLRRDAYVDTARPGVSASDRRAGGEHTARRNSKRSTAGFTATLEDSLTTPSRKSTRRAANRAKAATPLTARTQSRASAPRARHARGK